MKIKMTSFKNCLKITRAMNHLPYRKKRWRRWSNHPSQIYVISWQVSILLYIYASMYICMIFVCIDMYVYIYICMYIHVYIYMYTYIYIYICIDIFCCIVCYFCFALYYVCFFYDELIIFLYECLLLIHNFYVECFFVTHVL
jgi:hypothetical protein